MKQIATSSDIKGVWASILNRIDIDGAMDLNAIDEQLIAYAKAGVSGVYSGGTASEFHCQTEVEFQEISTRFATVAENHNLPFQIGAAHPLPQGGLDRITFAASLSPLAIQVTLPDWTPLDYASVCHFMDRATLAAEGVPLVLYNPPHAKTVLTPIQLKDLTKRYSSIIGLKCGGGDTLWYAAMATVLARVSVFIPGHFYTSGVAQGAHGSYSNMACLSPSAAVAWSKSNDAEAQDIEQRIASFMNQAIAPLLDRGLPGFVCDKAMATAGGWAKMNSQMMWPYEGVTADEITLIISAARRHIPEFTNTIPTDI